MAVINLVTTAEIAQNTPMGGNVDTDKYYSLINDVQVLILESVLGTKLYAKILTDFNADTLTGVYQTMYEDYIRQVVWHSVFAEYMKLGGVWVENNGMYRKAPEEAELATIDEIDTVARNYQSKADAYISRLERFL